MGVNPVGGRPPTGIVRAVTIFGAKNEVGGLTGAVLATADGATPGLAAVVVGDGRSEGVAE